MPSPRYKFCGSFRKFGTESYGISGAVSNAFARGGTFCCAKRGIAASTSTARNPNLNIRFMGAPLENVEQLYTRTVAAVYDRWQSVGLEPRRSILEAARYRA